MKRTRLVCKRFFCVDIILELGNFICVFIWLLFQVCSNCYIKLRLPVEKLKEVTVASLISQLSPTNESKTKDNLPETAESSSGFVRASLNRISLRSTKQVKPEVDVRKLSTPAQIRSPPPPSSFAAASPSITSSSYRPRMLR